EAHDCHAPREFRERHGYVAFDSHDAVVDCYDLTVRKDFPLLVEIRHGARSFRAGNSLLALLAPPFDLRDRLFPAPARRLKSARWPTLFKGPQWVESRHEAN